MRQIDPKRIEAVRRLLDENRNFTHREIAAKLKIGQTSAWKICAMLRPEGVVRKPRGKSKKLGKTAAQTLELITENPAISRKEIGAILHRDSSTISKAVTELEREKVVELVRRRENVEFTARIATLDELERNDFNLSVSSYVEPRDTREKIDIDQLEREIEECRRRADEIRREIDALLPDVKAAIAVMNGSRR